MFLVEIMDLIGTAAFAVSGVLVGIRNKLDLFGIFVLATITASGGGLIRDVIIKKGLPVFFTEPKYLITIVISTIIACVIVHFAYNFLNKIQTLIQIFDAIGLGVFTVLATYGSILAGVPIIGIVFTAVLTGVGGGVMRDIMANDVPLVFRSEIYALASIIGSLAFYFLYGVLDVTVNVYLCIFVVFAIRMVSMHFKLNLPIISIKDGAMGGTGYENKGYEEYNG